MGITDANGITRAEDPWVAEIGLNWSWEYPYTWQYGSAKGHKKGGHKGKLPTGWPQNCFRQHGQHKGRWEQRGGRGKGKAWTASTGKGGTEGRDRESAKG